MLLVSFAVEVRGHEFSSALWYFLQILLFKKTMNKTLQGKRKFSVFMKFAIFCFYIYKKMSF